MINHQMRLLILGLDGLDYNLVEKWRLSFFKQRYYGKHYIGFLKKLYTPIVWGCFLTGVNVEEHGYSLHQLVEKRGKDAFKSQILRRLYSIRKKVPIGNLRIRKILIKLGLVNPYQGSIMPESLLNKTFLKLLKDLNYKVATVEVPGYNEEVNEYFRSTYGLLLSASLDEKRAYIDKILEETDRRMIKTMDYIDKGYDLVFTYSPLPDIAFHIAVKPTLRIKVWLKNVHEHLQQILRPLIKEAENRNYTILIVSDHGFDLNKYYHSNYGFWSLSIEPPGWWSIETILDFKENIIKMITSE